MIGYVEYLIKQYYDKPKARADIELLDKRYEDVANLLLAFETEFDLDFARGAQLDILGKIVGISRIVPKTLPKVYFGFDNNINARGFGSITNPTRPSAPFFRIGQEAFTDTQLNDNDYRFFIKAKVALNYCQGVMVGDDERISIQDVVWQAFDGLAYVVDNENMTLTLYVSPRIDNNKLNLIRTLGLLPKPAGVGYKIIIQAEPNLTFGFKNNPNAKGFASINNPAYNGGVFARIYKG